ncbi:MAG: ATP-binding protein [Deltaproteobacteria bacterium]|nr:ATP-binding protein [Deltaproteobacteria bacterium]
MTEETIIAIASGKGGTGKTTVAVNMAAALSRASISVRLMDCDVEEPNAHIFLQPIMTSRESAFVPVPVVDEEKCDGCGRCGEACRFSAIVALGAKAITFPALCHSCGGCIMACPKKAITESSREIGLIEKGMSQGIEFIHGYLKIGEAMSPPLIRAVKKQATCDGVTIIDAPPGTSCPVIQAIRGSDYVILVTEPTPFGLHDLNLAVETVRQLGIPCGVVVNRVGIGDARTHDYCNLRDIRIIGEIPDDRRAAEAYSRGELLIDALPHLKEKFWGIFSRAADGARKKKREDEPR